MKFTKVVTLPVLIPLLILIVIFIFGAFPGIVSQYEPMQSGYADGLAPPSAKHPFGADQLGRDVLAWVLHGSSVAFMVGTTCTLLSFIVAITGMVAGYFGGRVDQLLMRITDLTMSVPRFVLIVVFATLFGSNITNIILIIGFLSWPTLARIMRAETLAFKNREFILSSKVLGTNPWNIMFTEIFPNILPAVIPTMALLFSHSIIDEVAISFLGLGDPAVASWGRLISIGRQAVFAGGWWALIFPCLVCVILLICINLLADRLNDILNPRMKKRINDAG